MFYLTFCLTRSLDGRRSVLLNHHICGFDNYRDLVTYLESQIFRAAPGNDAFNQVVANTYRDMGHDCADEDLFHAAGELISCGDGHSESRLHA
jgi:hypothetical protein